MNINMDKNTFDSLTEICRNFPIEKSGIMNTEVDYEDIYIMGFQFDDSDMIKNATPASIRYDRLDYLCDGVHRISFTDSPVFIRFHTHPGSGLPGLSKADTEALKYLQGLTTKVYKSNSNNGNLVIEGIITSSEIAFYTYDLDSDKSVRLPFFVDGVERIPSIEQSVLQRFMNAFGKGYQRGMRKK